MSDPLLEALTELRDAKIRIANAIALVNDAIIAQADHAVPRTDTIVPGLEAKTHPFASREDATGVPDVDEPPSRDP